MQTLLRAYEWGAFLLFSAALLSLIRHQKIRSNLLKNSIVAVTSFGLTLAVVEFTLRTGVLDDNPIWTPDVYKKIDKVRNARHYEFASRNIHRFNDPNRVLEKPPGIFRIAVLGDSFVWGWGTFSRDEIWSVRLGEKLSRANPKIETMNWGRNGWTTKEEFQFLKEEGIRYSPDLVIFGFVTNDLDLSGKQAETLAWQSSALLRPFQKFFPDALNLFSALVNRVIEQNVSGLGYEAWENAQYNPENLAHYLELLKEIRSFCDRHGIALLFALTPNNWSPIFRERFDKVIPLLEEARIPYLDLLPAVEQRAGHINPLRLQASRADAHPGPIVTEIFADEVFHFIAPKLSQSVGSMQVYSREP